MVKAATPTVHPPPGTYDVPVRVTLLCETPDVQLRYTIDDAPLSAQSPLFDPFKLILLEANEGDKGEVRHYKVRTIALREGIAASDAASFSYTIARRDCDQYVSRELYPGARMIADHESDKMYLLTGTRRALLIDAGFGRGDLRGYVEAFTRGLPLDVVVTHAHSDHVACLGQFTEDCNVYMNFNGLGLLKEVIAEDKFPIDTSKIQDIHEGFQFDLGDRTVAVYEFSGHIPGGIVLLDEQACCLFSGDAIGSNRPTSPDSLFLQFDYSVPIGDFLLTLKAFRRKLRGRIKEIWTGHNDLPLRDEGYLDNLEQAAQKLVDRGARALVPAIRPEGDWQVIVGDRLTDPNWAAINVSEKLKDKMR
jgi:glyoxylase-like metal-dependent hydrolase (beta-lactamase superfamily II)